MLFTRGNRQTGYAVIIDPAHGQPEDLDSITCGHCGAVTWMKPFQDGAAMGGRCTCCDKFICLKCVERYRQHGCITVEQMLEKWERRKQYDPD